MTSVDKAAMGWSIAIVAIAIGFTATGQSFTNEVSPSEMVKEKTYGFGAIGVPGEISSKELVDYQNQLDELGNQLKSVGDGAIILQAEIGKLAAEIGGMSGEVERGNMLTDVGSTTLMEEQGTDFDVFFELLTEQLGLVIDGSNTLQQQLGIIIETTHSLQQQGIMFDGPATLTEQLRIVGDNAITLQMRISEATQLLETYEKQLVSTGEVSQEALLQLQDHMQEQAQAMQTLSSIMKSQHDTLKSVIQNMR